MFFCCCFLKHFKATLNSIKKCSVIYYKIDVNRGCKTGFDSLCLGRCFGYWTEGNILISNYLYGTCKQIWNWSIGKIFICAEWFLNRNLTLTMKIIHDHEFSIHAIILARTCRINSNVILSSDLYCRNFAGKCLPTFEYMFFYSEKIYI